MYHGSGFWVPPNRRVHFFNRSQRTDTSKSKSSVYSSECKPPPGPRNSRPYYLGVLRDNDVTKAMWGPFNSHCGKFIQQMISKLLPTKPLNTLPETNNPLVPRPQWQKLGFRHLVFFRFKRLFPLDPRFTYYKSELLAQGEMGTNLPRCPAKAYAQKRTFA